MDQRDQFFVAHIFFLVAFVGLLGAAVVVLIRQRREFKPMLLAFLPLGLIFSQPIWVSMRPLPINS